MCRHLWGGIIRGVIWSVGERCIGKEETNMSAEENKALVRREQEELWNHTGTLEAAEGLLSLNRPRLPSRRQQISVEASRTR
jgi:hypothetical protein